MRQVVLIVLGVVVLGMGYACYNYQKEVVTLQTQIKISNDLYIERKNSSEFYKHELEIVKQQRDSAMKLLVESTQQTGQALDIIKQYEAITK